MKQAARLMAGKTFSGRKPSQNMRELRRFISMLRDYGVRSYLEVGARHGDTFHEVVRSLPEGSLGVAVDLPGGAWGKTGTSTALVKARDDLNARGYDARTVFGNSQHREVIDLVAPLAPFDAVLIDGDHAYDGVLADWQNYGHMAPLIAFHDIAGKGMRQKTTGALVEVPRLWGELKTQWLHREIVAVGSHMGIGVILR